MAVIGQEPPVVKRESSLSTLDLTGHLRQSDTRAGWPPMRLQARLDSPGHCRGRKIMTARMFSAFTLRALAACSGESANNGCR